MELGAVESGLLSCKGVTGCAVVVTGDTNKSLAAFVVMSQDAKTLATERSLKEQVSKKVARHEVPHRIVVIDRIPLNTSGKADRGRLKKQLAALEATAAATEPELQQKVLEPQRDGQVASTTTTAESRQQNQQQQIQQVQAVVRDLMKQVPGRNVEDSDSRSFWELGGTSLMAMTLDGLIQRETGVRVGMARMMQDGSLEGMSRQIERESARGTIVGERMTKQGR